MIIVVSQRKENREKAISDFLKDKKIFRKEVFFVPETNSNLDGVISAMSPSFFGEKNRAVVVRFFLENASTEELKKVLEAEKEFEIEIILEETNINSDIKKFLEKEKVNLKVLKEEIKKEETNVFEIANALSSGDKKKIWLSYQSLLKKESPEAIFGVILWKVRQMSEKDKKYTSWYKKLLNAQLVSRTSKVPFEISLEKTLITLK